MADELRRMVRKGSAASGVFALAQLVALTSCSHHHQAETNGVDPERLSNFIEAQQDALNRAEAEEANESAAEAKGEIGRASGNADLK